MEKGLSQILSKELFEQKEFLNRFLDDIFKIEGINKENVKYHEDYWLIGEDEDGEYYQLPTSYELANAVQIAFKWKVAV